MKIVGCIYDEGTNSKLQSASVKVVKKNGSVAQSAQTDNAGEFALNSPDLDKGAMVLISCPGYQQILVDPKLFLACSEVGLMPGTGLPAKIISLPANQQKAIKIALALAAAGTAAYFIFRKKKKKGQGMGSIDYTPFLLLAALGIAGYVVYEKFFGGGAGTAASAANKTAVTTTNATATAQTQADIAATGQTPTLTASQLSSNANSIFSLGLTGNPVPDDDQEQIRDIVIECNNDADWIGLVSAFGTKNVSSAGFLQQNTSGGNLSSNADDLPTFLRGTLDQSYIDSINDFFTNTGINAQL